FPARTSASAAAPASATRTPTIFNNFMVVSSEHQSDESPDRKVGCFVLRGRGARAFQASAGGSAESLALLRLGNGAPAQTAYDPTHGEVARHSRSAWFQNLT